MGQVMQIAVSAVAFLVAAKAHGRELRLEREAAGVMRVVFGGDNPPLVEALWAAERGRFWPTTVALGLVAALLLLKGGWPRATIAQAALLWAPTLVFVALGVASFMRAGGLERGGVLGSVGWWALSAAAITLALQAGLCRG